MKFRLITPLLFLGVLSISLAITRQFGGRIGLITLGVGVMLLAAGTIAQSRWINGNIFLTLLTAAAIGQAFAGAFAFCTIALVTSWRPEDSSFHPLVAGTLAAIMVGFDCGLIVYPLAAIIAFYVRFWRIAFRPSETK